MRSKLRMRSKLIYGRGHRLKEQREREREGEKRHTRCEGQAVALLDLWTQLAMPSAVAVR